MAADETNEFLASAGTDGPGTVEDLSAWASRLLSSPESRAGIERQFKDGRISATLFAWLREQANRIEQAERERQGKSPAKTLVEACTDFELDVLVNVCRRAQGREESPIRVPGTAMYLSLTEMLATLAEVYRP